MSKNKKARLSAEQTAEAQNALKQHARDVGSPQVQIAGLTARINLLTGHMAANRNDKHSRRGLIGMVSARRKLLKYLKRSDADTHAKTLAALGLRK